jgi:hypothetical protein
MFFNSRREKIIINKIFLVAINFFIDNALSYQEEDTLTISTAYTIRRP